MVPPIKELETSITASLTTSVQPQILDQWKAAYQKNLLKGCVLTMAGLCPANNCIAIS